ncbi:MAG TPA: deoxyhypusine synthase family protein [Vicinamibacterales bacterium]|nr:deoxyhypusine synthase family protein [Vicinamibacterales bacterium]
MPRSRFLHTPVEPFRVEPNLTADGLLTGLERISFQGRNLGVAYRVWRRMLAEPDLTIFLGVAGALSAGGLRLVIAHAITNRWVDCVVSTGANLYHDLHETRGRRHYIGSPAVSDTALQEERIDRVYDTFASEEEFVENDNWIADFTLTLEPRPYSSREFLYRLGERLWNETGTDGILTAAYRASLPIYCPAIADSSIGMGIAQARHIRADAASIDVVADVVESSNLVIASGATASVVLGGGTPKNFINQAIVEAEYFAPRVEGHRFAVQIVTDVPHFGGASGSTLEEAQSWGKVATDAARVTVNADATIALPLLAAALESQAAAIARERKPAAYAVENGMLIRAGRRIASTRFDEQS